MAEFEHDRLSVRHVPGDRRARPDLKIDTDAGERIYELRLWCYEGNPELEAVPGKYQAHLVCKTRPDGLFYWSIAWANPRGDVFISAHSDGWLDESEYRGSVARTRMSILMT